MNSLKFICSIAVARNFNISSTNTLVQSIIEDVLTCKICEEICYNNYIIVNKSIRHPIPKCDICGTIPDEYVTFTGECNDARCYTCHREITGGRPLVISEWDENNIGETQDIYKLSANEYLDAKYDQFYGTMEAILKKVEKEFLLFWCQIAQVIVNSFEGPWYFRFRCYFDGKFELVQYDEIVTGITDRHYTRPMNENKIKKLLFRAHKDVEKYVI